MSDQFRTFCLKILLAALAVVFFGGATASAQGTAWHVSKASGDVTISATGAQPVALTDAATVNPGDVIRTGANGRVLLTRGAETMLLKLLSATEEQYRHAVVSLKDEGIIGPRIKELGVPVYSLGIRPGAPNPFRVFSIRSVVRQFRPDLIQGWMYHGNLMASFASKSWPQRPPVLWGIHQSIRTVSDYGRRTGLVIRLGALFSRSPAKLSMSAAPGRCNINL